MNEQISNTQVPPPNYLAFAILVTIFCGKIFGIVAIIFAAQVNSKWSAGDIAGATNASRNAKLWAWISLIAGGAWIIILILLSIFGIFAGLTLGNF